MNTTNTTTPTIATPSSSDSGTIATLLATLFVVSFMACLFYCLWRGDRPKKSKKIKTEMWDDTVDDIINLDNEEEVVQLEEAPTTLVFSS